MLDETNVVILISVIYGSLMAGGFGFCIAVGIIAKVSDIGKEHAPFEIFSLHDITVLERKSTLNYILHERWMQKGQEKGNRRWSP